MPGIILRPLAPLQTEIAAGIHRRGMATVPCFDPDLRTPEEDRDFYRDRVFPACTILGAWVEGVLLGHVAWRPGWIDHLYVDPPYHSRGIGTLLLDAVKAEIDDIRLWTFQANLGARRFYARHGFVAEEFTDGSGNEERQPDVRYRWRRH